MIPWEWFLPAKDRHLFKSEMMEGPHGGGGTPMTPHEVLGWSIGLIVLLIMFGFFVWFAMGWR